MDDLIVLIARIFLGAVFLISGIDKTIFFGEARAEFRKAKLPYPDFCLGMVIPLHFFAGLGIILGVFTQFSSFLLAGFMLCVTLWIHDFWNRPTRQARLESSRLALANYAIFGGLLMLVANGPGTYVVG
jgi:putative oxidoreductase